MAQVPPYSRYADVYDATGQTEFAQRAWPYVLGRAQRLGWKGKRALDLACGTAAAVPLMRADGLDVWAVDRSREMLLGGLERAPRRLVRGDFRALPFAPQTFDLVVSLYDSVNYLLTLADLAAALTEVARVLRPGGMFAFDLNTRYTLREHWEGVCQARLDDDVASIWQATWDETTSISSLCATFFVCGPDGRWDRFDEVHDERGFKNSELDQAIRASGLELALSEDFHARRKPGGQSRRVFYWLRRRR